MEFIKPRKHVGVEEVIEKAKKGDAFFVRRALLNGDLSILPDSQQRKIIATAYDNAAAYASDQVIPQTSETLDQNDNFIEKHLDMASRLFFNANGKSIKQEILDSD